MSTAAQASPGRGEILAPSPYARQVNRAKYRAKQAGYPGPHFTEAEWLALILECEERCLRCGARGDLTVDQVIPLSLGGSNTIENIQPLCAVCNGIKGCEVRDYRPGYP